MTEKIIQISIQDARRIAVTKQHLAGKLPTKPTKEHILSVLRDIIYVQWDPIQVVAPSHVIALWNRIGNFRLSDLNILLWEEKKLFKNWAGRFAGIGLTEDYSLYYSLMKRYPESLGDSWGAQRAEARKFLAEHKQLAKSMVEQLKKGPMQLKQFKEYTRTKRSSDGWSPGSTVSQMLSHLEMSGRVMVVGQDGIQNVWGLPEEFLPSWVQRNELSEWEFERLAAQRSIRALGTALPREINYFPRGCYHDLKRTLRSLIEDSVIHRVQVDGTRSEERYIHDLDVPLLESMDSEEWHPRVSLLPPFDNLTSGRQRTKRIFGFEYYLEMFFPKDKRKFGYYVLSILYGDKLIGRIDPVMDRRYEKLLINSVHAEPVAPSDKNVAMMISETIDRFAEFLGAREVIYSSRVPAAWKSYLR